MQGRSHQFWSGPVGWLAAHTQNFFYDAVSKKDDEDLQDNYYIAARTKSKFLAIASNVLMCVGGYLPEK